ncbi:unnamed protein product [Rangifer tarandus platyrhynchus]|uniref:Uncharacterized protein n=2 Tax=Rangifer tarandus platyrhynchus TaxID=3082113 RepID=A0AC60A3K3_RANTA|nr:unnamed protein product [Rangifer tarandus platyrhynchus]
MPSLDLTAKTSYQGLAVPRASSIPSKQTLASLSHCTPGLPNPPHLAPMAAPILEGALGCPGWASINQSALLGSADEEARREKRQEVEGAGTCSPWTGFAFHSCHPHPNSGSSPWQQYRVQSLALLAHF